MEQPCPRCGYVSDRPARFCRQCGTPLFTESEASQAATRNYAPNQAPPAHQQQPAATPGYTPYQYIQSGDEPTPETTRFYRPPLAPEPAPLAAQPPTRSSHTGKILLIVLLGLVVIGGGITLLIITQLHDIVDGPGRPVPVHPVPPVPPVAPPPPGGQSSGLEQYQYPGAQVTQSVRALGNEVLMLTTTDSVDKVTEHYRKQLGQPMVQSRDANGPNVVFQISGSPSTLITIHPDKNEDGKTAISIVRTKFALPDLK